MPHSLVLSRKRAFSYLSLLSLFFFSVALPAAPDPNECGGSFGALVHRRREARALANAAAQQKQVDEATDGILQAVLEGVDSGTSPDVLATLRDRLKVDLEVPVAAIDTAGQRLFTLEHGHGKATKAVAQVFTGLDSQIAKAVGAEQDASRAVKVGLWIPIVAGAIRKARASLSTPNEVLDRASAHLESQLETLASSAKAYRDFLGQLEGSVKEAEQKAALLKKVREGLEKRLKEVPEDTPEFVALEAAIHEIIDKEHSWLTAAEGMKVTLVQGKITLPQMDAQRRILDNQSRAHLVGLRGQVSTMGMMGQTEAAAALAESIAKAHAAGMLKITAGLEKIQAGQEARLNSGVKKDPALDAAIRRLEALGARQESSAKKHLALRRQQIAVLEDSGRKLDELAATQAVPALPAPGTSPTSPSALTEGSELPGSTP